MKSDKNGVSQCANGTENYESFKVGGKKFIQYDYRTPGGKLFSTVGPTLELCRKKRDAWLRDGEK